MLKNSLFVLIALLSGSSFGQYSYEYDTLSINHRMYGKADSADAKSGLLPTTFDGGVALLNAQGFSIDRLNNDFGGLRFNSRIQPRKMRFSALPYIGFGYSFGAQGTQFVRAEYVQSFTDSLVVNIDYAANIGTGYLRNANFRSSRVNANIEWKAKRYTLQFQGAYFSDSLSHNGGISDPSSVETFGLEFAPVYKSNATSKNQYGKIGLNNYFFFNKEGQNRVGLVTRHLYDIKYRAYHEFSDTLSSIYASTNIDTLETYDRVNLARLQNSGGLFFARGNKYVDFSVGHTYWSNLNLGNDFDTTEIDLASQLRWNFGPILLKNSFRQNIYGLFGALSEEASLSYDVSKWIVGAKLGLYRNAPDPFKRSYFANNYSYALSEINLEDRLTVGGSVHYRIKGDSINVGAHVNSLAVRNAYLFDGVDWNPSGALNALQFGLTGQFQAGKFHFHPRVIYSSAPNSYLPQIQGYARVFFKSRVFKAKKLLLLIGVDGSYISDYQPRNFVPSMGAYTWELTSAPSKGMANTHFFTSIEISTFRFFVRYENIGYFWNDKLTEEYVGYPIASQRVRLGLSWSFFN